MATLILMQIISCDVTISSKFLTILNSRNVRKKSFVIKSGQCIEKYEKEVENERFTHVIEFEYLNNHAI
jgi:hypothetical protein